MTDKTQAKEINFFNSRTVDDNKLQSIKLEYIEGILFTVAALIKESKRTDGLSIITHIENEIEQIDIAATEQGRRSEQRHNKFIEDLLHD